MLPQNLPSMTSGFLATLVRDAALETDWRVAWLGPVVAVPDRSWDTTACSSGLFRLVGRASESMEGPAEIDQTMRTRQEPYNGNEPTWAFPTRLESRILGSCLGNRRWNPCHSGPCSFSAC